MAGRAAGDRHTLIGYRGPSIDVGGVPEPPVLIPGDP